MIRTLFILLALNLPLKVLGNDLFGFLLSSFKDSLLDSQQESLLKTIQSLQIQLDDLLKTREALVHKTNELNKIFSEKINWPKSIAIKGWFFDRTLDPQSESSLFLVEI